MSYKSTHTGAQIDAGINAALNPDVAVTPDSDALVTSRAVADALDNINPTITSNTDTTLNGILVGDGGKVGAKSLDTSSLTNDADHVPTSGVVKSAIVNVENDLATIHQTSPTCTETNGIAAGVFFYLDNELVVAKTAIANGAAFTLNTNYEVPTAGALNALKSAINFFDDIPGTVQTVNFDANGNPSSIVHTANGEAVRTDSFTWGVNTVTEKRELADGSYITFVTNLTTLVTTISEIQEA